MSRMNSSLTHFFFFFLAVCDVGPPSQLQTDPCQGHWLVIGERWLWLKFIFYTPPPLTHPPTPLLTRHICIATGQACSSQCVWDQAAGASVLWGVGCLSTTHISAHVWTGINTYAYALPLTTHEQSPAASPLSLSPPTFQLSKTRPAPFHLRVPAGVRGHV